MLGKVILWISSLAFVSYGLLCFFDPQIPGDFAGLDIANGDGYAELGGMYGGLQTGYGLFCLLGALRRDLYRPALLSLVLMLGSLAIGRLYSSISNDQVVGLYTWGAMAFEFATAALACIALRHQPGLNSANP
ncbi:MAG: DUF4345 family protein [Halioglobus sp.]|nr:DUF4345 family protein [Halioglobus sp.]